MNMVIIGGHIMGRESRDTFICVFMQKVCSWCNGSGKCPNNEPCYKCACSGRERYVCHSPCTVVCTILAFEKGTHQLVFFNKKI